MAVRTDVARMFAVGGKLERWLFPLSDRPFGFAWVARNLSICLQFYRDNFKSPTSPFASRPSSHS